MKIYTKTGDKGQTSLIGGVRVSKSSGRIDSYGTVDELNSNIGMLRDLFQEIHTREALLHIQNLLFVIGSHLASDPEKSRMQLPDLHEEDITYLEQEIDAMNKQIPELKHFILPGGHPANSQAHICRTICRRAERAIVSLSEEEPVEEIIIKYLNRLSDYLFTVARFASWILKTEEIKWVPERRTKA